MLNFFRKYQKIFFIIVTIFVVISFCFFGTFGTYSNQQQDPDRIVGKTLKGTSITFREMEAMNRLLGSSYEERSVLPNLFNDGVIRKEFLNTGMGHLLAEQYFSKIKQDLEPRLKKAKYYKPYVHPKAHFISSEQVWQQYFPSISRDLGLLKGLQKEATIEEFNLLTRLYMAELQLPPDSLKQLLVYQQNSHSVPPDPQLQQTDLSLFGFHSFEDWFGPQFLNEISRFVFNSAAIAEEKGYKVTLEEAHADLIQNIQTALTAYGLKVEETPGYFAQQLHVLQLDEATAVKTWQKVILFRRLFHDVGNVGMIDPFLYENFQKYANEGITAEVYRLPEEFHLKDFHRFIELQAYLEAVSIPHKKGNAFPTLFLKPEEVEKKFPELVEKKFVVSFKEVNKDQLASRIGLKETWEWEVSDHNWEVLQNAFFFDASVQTQEDRFQFLEKLDVKERLKVDAFARGKIVDTHPEWLEESFEMAPLQTKTLSIRSKGGSLPLTGIDNRATFIDLLERASLKEEKASVLSARQQLENFSGDGINHYRLNVIEVSNQKTILSFKEAISDGTLQKIVDKRLETAYVDVRRKESGIFQNANGSWKPFQEVKEEIGRRIYQDLIAELQNRPELFLASFMQEAQKQLELQPDHSSWVRRGDTEMTDSFQNQWLLEKTTRTLSRSSQDNISKEELLQLPVGSWSNLQTPENGDLLFVHVLDKVEGEHELRAIEGQEILSIGARRFLMSKILNEMIVHGL